MSGDADEQRTLGIPYAAWELLDPALREALIAGRITPEELPELEGWLDNEDERDDEELLAS